MLNRESILTEQAVEALAEIYGFRQLRHDIAAINPNVFFRIESFVAEGDFKPSRPFKSRLVWRDESGVVQSKLFVSTPDEMIAVIAPSSSAQVPSSNEASAQRPKPRRRRPAVAQRNLG